MINTDQQKIKEILTRGVAEIIVEKDLQDSLSLGRKLRIYYGVDPTGAELHLGHAVVLWKLRALQELGHEVILLMGDFTARIGDPSGKDAARVPLTEKQVKENMKDYKKQASKILDFGKVDIKFNSKWLSKLNFSDILSLASNFTVQQMIQRDMFARRIKEEKPISLQEFMYPLMQGYDSVAMDVDLEVAGIDQIFNALAGRTLQKVINKKDKNVLTTKLLLGTDGRKMSKTYNNTISLGDSAKDMFGKIMSLRDELMLDYFELCTKVSLEKIAEIKESLNGGTNPRDVKANLAKEIVSLYYSLDEAKKAETEFNKVFQSGGMPSEVSIFRADKDSYPILDLLVSSKLAPSKNEAKRLVEGGGVDIILNEKETNVTNWKEEIKVEDGMIIRRGKRQFVKIKK